MRVIEKTFLVTQAEGHFEGHFPGHPLVPAAAQVAWMLDLARTHGLLESRVYRVSQLKLLRELPPGVLVTVRLRERESDWQGEVSTQGETAARCLVNFTP